MSIEIRQLTVNSDVIDDSIGRGKNAEPEKDPSCNHESEKQKELREWKELITEFENDRKER